MRMLLLRTSAAARAPHLTLHHAYARLADLKAQLRHLQAAAATEAAQQLQEQLQTQRQQAQLADAQAAEQQAETQASTQPLHHAQSLAPNSAPASSSSSSTSAVQRPELSLDAQQPPPPSYTGSHPGQNSMQPYGHTYTPGQAAAASTSTASCPIQPSTEAPVSSSSFARQASNRAAVPAVSMLTGQAQQASRAAPMSLLEIQAEQEAEAARAAEAAKASQAGHAGRGKPRSEGPAKASSAASSQPGQARVLQVGMIACALWHMIPAVS